MHTPDVFEQFAQGMGDPQQFGQWLKGQWPIPVDRTAATSHANAWIGSLESLLHGAEALGQLQMDTMQKTQERTSRLAKSLGDARSPADSAVALQAFAQDNLQEAAQFWAAYREIVQGAELPMAGGAGKLAGHVAGKSGGKTRARPSLRKRARTA